jgi:hypothetical protein
LYLKPTYTVRNTMNMLTPTMSCSSMCNATYLLEFNLLPPEDVRRKHAHQGSKERFKNKVATGYAISMMGT